MASGSPSLVAGRATRGAAGRPRGAARAARLRGRSAARRRAAAGEEVIGERHPDMAVVGVDLPDERGTELVRRITAPPGSRSSSSTPASTTPTCSRRRYRSGARGLVAKPAGLAVPGRGAAGGLAGRPLLRPAASSAARRRRSPAKALSGRESEILGFLADGLTGEQIAERLVLSPETVRTHVRNAMEKLEARTRTEAVVKATRAREKSSARADFDCWLQEAPVFRHSPVLFGAPGRPASRLHNRRRRQSMIYTLMGYLHAADLAAGAGDPAAGRQ